MTILNKANVWVNSDQTAYELWYAKRPTIKHFRVFGRKCFIKKTDEKLGKLEPREDEGILPSYSSRSKGYKCYKRDFEKLLNALM